MGVIWSVLWFSIVRDSPQKSLLTSEGEKEYLAVSTVPQPGTETSKQPIRTRYLCHVTGYQPIRDQYFLIRSMASAVAGGGAGGGGSMFGSLRKFDAYPKTIDDFRIKTCGGATITIVSGIIMIALFLAELNFYLGVSIRETLLMDTTRSELMDIYIDVTFHKIPCEYLSSTQLTTITTTTNCKYPPPSDLSVDAMDVSGGQQVDVDQDVQKIRLGLDGEPYLPVTTSQEPTETSKQPIRTSYLGHVTGYQLIR
eukprot:sb/3468645/